MPSINREIKIDQEQLTVWNILSDIGAIENFNPTVKKSFCTSEEKSGIGASRHCDLLPMGSVEERVTRWEKGKMLSMEIYESKGTPMLGEALFTLSKEGDGTLATMKLDYKMKGGFAGKFMGLMMRGKLERTVEGILSGLKTHSETGEYVTFELLKEKSEAMAA